MLVSKFLMLFWKYNNNLLMKSLVISEHCKPSEYPSIKISNNIVFYTNIMRNIFLISLLRIL